MKSSMQCDQEICLQDSNFTLERVIVEMLCDLDRSPDNEVKKKKQLPACRMVAFFIDKESNALLGPADIIDRHYITHNSGAAFHVGDGFIDSSGSVSEQILFNLMTIPEKYSKIILCAFVQGKYVQYLDDLNTLSFNILDGNTGIKVSTYIPQNFSTRTKAVFFGELRRKNNKWRFASTNHQTSDNDVTSLADRFLANKNERVV